MTPLEIEIRRIIALDGPIPVADFMRLCLTHPQHGYYTGRDPFGVSGDFVTAPEISQMFGELIGAWAAAVWRQMGAPERVNLVELGPGRGTLMADALRAAKAAPDFRTALAVHLVETSPVLRARQRETLAHTNAAVTWHTVLGELPDGPAIILANEFFDALPVHHAVRDHDGWHERAVALGDGDQLAFAVNPLPMLDFESTLPRSIGAAPAGTIFEWRSNAFALQLVQRLDRVGGAALIIDYGHVQSSFGETLQAVRGHSYADPLAGPGLVDLTAHVDFAALARIANAAGAHVNGPLPQGEFLRRLGIVARAARLKASATPAQAAGIDAALSRLTGPDQMGELFKVLAIADARLGALPGFDGC